MPPAVLNKAQKAEAVRRYVAGEASARAIALDMGVSPNTIRNAILDAGHLLSNKLLHLSASAIGRPSALKGTKRSAESIAKQIQSRRDNGAPARSGYKHSPETLAKISAGTKGKNVRFTQEERAQRERVRQACKRFLRRVLRASGARKTTPTQVLLGYSAGELSSHLGQLQLGDHIDHIVPVTEFFRRGIFDPAIINALPNLQRMSGPENRSKGARVPDNADEVIAKCELFATQRRTAEDNSIGGDNGS